MPDMPAAPTTVLIAALGGEGGGVMMNWVVAAARAAGYPVQATSVPGVAQRTGATTYYIEFVPETGLDTAPVMSLSPTPGEVDLLIASELAEAGRALAGGFVTPDRTTVVASTSRHYTNLEKMALGDGRVDAGKLRTALQRAAQSAVLFDAADAARRDGTFLNAIMVGAAVGSGALALDEAHLRAAIEAEGKAVAANVKGLEIGLALARQDGDAAAAAPAGEEATDRRDDAAFGGFPAAARETIRLGHARAVDYQDAAYGRLYLDRLRPFQNADARLVDTVARHLAVRMTYDDIIRVAQVKIGRERFARIRGEAGAKPRDAVHVTDFFKPGIPEIADLMPPALAARLLRWAAKGDRLTRWSWPMHVRTTTIWGFLKVWLLAHLRWWRPRSFRWHGEQAEIEGWLDLIAKAAAIDAAAALEVAELARLIKGYGSTHQRGTGHYRRILDEVVVPGLAGNAADLAAQIRDAREAALADASGAALEACLAMTRPASSSHHAAAAD